MLPMQKRSLEWKFRERWFCQIVLYLSGSDARSSFWRPLHMTQAFTKERILTGNSVHEKAGYTQMSVARCKMFTKYRL